VEKPSNRLDLCSAIRLLIFFFDGLPSAQTFCLDLDAAGLGYMVANMILRDES